MAAAAGAVFVSYRRKDTGHAAYRIRERLAGQLGEESVFMDVDSIRPGEDFVARISQAVGVPCSSGADRQGLDRLVAGELLLVLVAEARRLHRPRAVRALQTTSWCPPVPPGRPGVRSGARPPVCPPNAGRTARA